ncbi:MAG: hypothetical protein HYZ89_06235 [Candidatus Omnitrophica bacterium]|nr:hypothetical protein [Candidatus Omnitrophota bacterium]
MYGRVSLQAVSLSLLLVGAGGGGVAWMLAVQGVDRNIEQKRAGLKRLHMSGHIPPNREVIEYLTARATALDAQYQAALKLLASPSSDVEGTADPQLYFQQRVHEVQRTLERLATARNIEPPEQLGVPKELPPPDAVPRLLVQLALIENAAELIVPQGISKLASVKLDDPQAVAPAGEKAGVFLTRLPVRLRLTCSLDVVAKILGIVDRARPLMDLQSLHVATAEAPPSQPTDNQPAPAVVQGTHELDVELILCRYLVTTPELPVESSDEEPSGKKPGARKAKKVTSE